MRRKDTSRRVASDYRKVSPPGSPPLTPLFPVQADNEPISGPPLSGPSIPRESASAAMIPTQSPSNRPSAPLPLMHGTLSLPIYLPDATLGVVRSVDSADLEQVGIEALVMNVFHLMQKPGTSTINALGGLHKMAHWQRPIITDSGGFQAYSLVRQNPKFGKLNEQGIQFKPEGAEREFQLTPEKSVQLQLAYGADIVICLDDCTNIADSLAEQERSVARTIKWAKRCKDEFLNQLRARKIPYRPLTENQSDDEAYPRRPLLFGVIQGGGQPHLRRECAQALLDIGFDGFGYGGWPLDENGALLSDMLQITREAIPAHYPMHALGIGSPDSVVQCVRMGYGIFDCALPTRDARNGRLYVWRSDPGTQDFSIANLVKKDWHDTLYIDDEKHIKTDRPISPYCDCPTCRRYAIGYLRHLRKAGETLYFRLATLHNLRFMTQLIASLRLTAWPAGSGLWSGQNATDLERARFENMAMTEEQDA